MKDTKRPYNVRTRSRRRPSFCIRRAHICRLAVRPERTKSIHSPLRCKRHTTGNPEDLLAISVMCARRNVATCTNHVINFMSSETKDSDVEEDQPLLARVMISDSPLFYSGLSKLNRSESICLEFWDARKSTNTNDIVLVEQCTKSLINPYFVTLFPTLVTNIMIAYTAPCHLLLLHSTNGDHKSNVSIVRVVKQSVYFIGQDINPDKIPVLSLPFSDSLSRLARRDTESQARRKSSKSNKLRCTENCDVLWPCEKPVSTMLELYEDYINWIIHSEDFTRSERFDCGRDDFDEEDELPSTTIVRQCLCIPRAKSFKTSVATDAYRLNIFDDESKQLLLELVKGKSDIEVTSDYGTTKLTMRTSDPAPRKLGFSCARRDINESILRRAPRTHIEFVWGALDMVPPILAVSYHHPETAVEFYISASNGNFNNQDNPSRGVPNKRRG